MIEVFDCEQNSAEWLEARRGIPTASEFSTVISEPRAEGHLPQNVMDAMVKSGCTAEQLAAAVKAAKRKYSNVSAVRKKYLYRLAGEIITGQVAETFSNAHTERGHEMEGEARELYAFSNAIEPVQVGFVRNGNVGCSPDSLIGDDGGLEIKTALPDIQIDRLLRGTLPSEHRAQVQGSLWVTEREWWDFVSYWPGLPLFTVRVERDEDYIKTLADEVERFNQELAEVVERVRKYGALPAAA